MRERSSTIELFKSGYFNNVTYNGFAVLWEYTASSDCATANCVMQLDGTIVAIEGELDIHLLRIKSTEKGYDGIEISDNGKQFIINSFSHFIKIRRLQLIEYVYHEINTVEKGRAKRPYSKSDPIGQAKKSNSRSDILLFKPRSTSTSSSNTPLSPRSRELIHSIAFDSLINTSENQAKIKCYEELYKKHKKRLRKSRQRIIVTKEHLLEMKKDECHLRLIKIKRKTQRLLRDMLALLDPYYQEHNADFAFLQNRSNEIVHHFRTGVLEVFKKGYLKVPLDHEDLEKKKEEKDWTREDKCLVNISKKLEEARIKQCIRRFAHENLPSELVASMIKSQENYRACYHELYQCVEKRGKYLRQMKGELQKYRDHIDQYEQRYHSLDWVISQVIVDEEVRSETYVRKHDRITVNALLRIKLTDAIVAIDKAYQLFHSERAFLNSENIQQLIKRLKEEIKPEEAKEKGWGHYIDHQIKENKWREIIKDWFETFAAKEASNESEIKNKKSGSWIRIPKRVPKAFSF